MTFKTNINIAIVDDGGYIIETEGVTEYDTCHVFTSKVKALKYIREILESADNTISE